MKQQHWICAYRQGGRESGRAHTVFSRSASRFLCKPCLHMNKLSLILGRSVSSTDNDSYHSCTVEYVTQTYTGSTCTYQFKSCKTSILNCKCLWLIPAYRYCIHTLKNILSWLRNEALRKYNLSYPLIQV